MTELGIMHELAEKELEEANEKYPLFHSPHEAYAVIAEEQEECSAEMCALNNAIWDMWQKVKHDEDYSVWLKLAEGHAINLAREAIQVAAMCKKARMKEMVEK